MDDTLTDGKPVKPVPRTTIKMTVPRAASVSLVEEIKSQLAFSDYDLTVEDIDDEAAVEISGESSHSTQEK